MAHRRFATPSITNRGQRSDAVSIFITAKPEAVTLAMRVMAELESAGRDGKLLCEIADVVLEPKDTEGRSTPPHRLIKSAIEGLRRKGTPITSENGRYRIGRAGMMATVMATRSLAEDDEYKSPVEDRAVTDAEMAVLRVLRSFQGDADDDIWLSRSEIEDELGSLSRETVSRSIHYLALKGFPIAQCRLSSGDKTVSYRLLTKKQFDNLVADTNIHRNMT